MEFNGSTQFKATVGDWAVTVISYIKFVEKAISVEHQLLARNKIITLEITTIGPKIIKYKISGNGVILESGALFRLNYFGEPALCTISESGPQVLRINLAGLLALAEKMPGHEFLPFGAIFSEFIGALNSLPEIVMGPAPLARCDSNGSSLPSSP